MRYFSDRGLRLSFWARRAGLQALIPDNTQRIMQKDDIFNAFIYFNLCGQPNSKVPTSLIDFVLT